MAVKYIKLTNGESIITDVKTENEFSLECVTPMMTAINQTQEGDVMIAFVRWLPFSEIETLVSIKKTAILIMTDVTEGITKHFNNVMIQLRTREEEEGKDNISEESPTSKPTEEELAFDAELLKKGMSIVSKLKN